MEGLRPGNKFPIESNFGILHDNWSKKVGFDDLYKQINKFYN